MFTSEMSKGFCEKFVDAYHLNPNKEKFDDLLDDRIKVVFNLVKETPTWKDRELLTICNEPVQMSKQEAMDLMSVHHFAIVQKTRLLGKDVDDTRHNNPKIRTETIQERVVEEKVLPFNIVDVNEFKLDVCNDGKVRAVAWTAYFCYVDEDQEEVPTEEVTTSTACCITES
ncbi:MAG: hypothetical protein H7A37_05815 [Chlamydiales bacterium]|nr:hypothetical protein [Chlamydiia bacterium]MCP5507797.1 hypothetical protein [Chlamydiales bacterium]